MRTTPAGSGNLGIHSGPPTPTLITPGRSPIYHYDPTQTSAHFETGGGAHLPDDFPRPELGFSVTMRFPKGGNPTATAEVIRNPKDGKAGLIDVYVDVTNKSKINTTATEERRVYPVDIDGNMQIGGFSVRFRSAITGDILGHGSISNIPRPVPRGPA